MYFSIIKILALLEVTEDPRTGVSLSNLEQQHLYNLFEAQEAYPPTFISTLTLPLGKGGYNCCSFKSYIV